MRALKLGKVTYEIIKQGIDKITGENVYLLKDQKTNEMKCFYEDDGVLIEVE
jgi:hypothetical protein